MKVLKITSMSPLIREPLYTFLRNPTKKEKYKEENVSLYQ